MKDKIRREIFLVGIGGQGVKLLSILLAKAYMKKGWYALQSSVYASAPRGGLTRSEVVVANYEYWYPKCRRPDIAVFLEGKYFDWYKDKLDGAVVVADSTQKEKIEPHRGDLKVVYHPFIEITRDEMKHPKGLNMYVLGFIAGFLGDLDTETLIEVMRDRLGDRSFEENKRALEAGYEEGRKLREVS